MASKGVSERADILVYSTGSTYFNEQVATRGIEVNPHGCRLLPYGTSGFDGPMQMHVRQKSGQSVNGKIGWKPTTLCATTPRIIGNTNLFYRTTLFGLWYPEFQAKSGSVSYSKQWTQRTIEYVCKSQKWEEWKGRTISTVTAMNGNVYAAQQHTQQFKVNCGIS